jgi:hypothetical protein
MQNGKISLAGPATSFRPELEAARGTLRESLGALHNLDQLLKSIRVGPKAIGSVLDDVNAACAPMRQAASELLTAIGKQPAAREACHALDLFFTSRVEELGRELSRARQQRMNAKNRLALERVVSRLWQELDTASGLITLLHQSIWSPSIRIDMGGLIQETTVHRMDSANGVTIEATLAQVEGSVEASVRPRVAIGMLAHGVTLVAGARPERSPPVNPTIVVDSLAGGCRLNVVDRQERGTPVAIPACRIIGPTLPSLAACAELAGARIEHAADNSKFAIFW